MDLLNYESDLKDLTGSQVYKDECIYSFDNKYSPEGLYFCLKNHVAVGKKYLSQYASTWNCHVFLNIRGRREAIPTSQVSPKRMAIGVEGGFSAPSYNYVDSFSVILMPQFTRIELEDVGSGRVRGIINGVIAGESAYRGFQKDKMEGKWEGEDIRDSILSDDLKQEEGFAVDLSSLQCEDCELKTNLWLNLSDGSVRCGRGYFDGTGGNNHSLDHYERTGYPLAVKLGTICPDSAPDVFSYAEGTMVRDSRLKEHLLHWGVDLRGMTKTDKTMNELEIDLNSNHKWCSIRELDYNCAPLSGKGLTGIHNIGNTCYIASVLQVMAATPQLRDAYSRVDCSHPLETIFSDIHFQLGKLITGLNCDDYSVQPPDDLTGVHPHSLVRAISSAHFQFGDGTQQDACEFIEWIVSQLPPPLQSLFSFETVSTLTSDELPGESLGNISSTNSVLSLYLTSGGPCLTSLTECLDRFCAGEVISGYFSDRIGRSVEAVSSLRFLSLPSVLVVRLCRFTVDSEWKPYKIDSSLEMPPDLDLTSYLSPNTGSLPVDDDKLAQLFSMGYGLEAARLSLTMCQNDLNGALDWLFDHHSDYHPNPDTPAHYRMFAFISHVGNSTERGHYLCHIIKDGQWVIFDDSKVAQSVCPRPDLGYIFFYGRV